MVCTSDLQSSLRLLTVDYCLHIATVLFLKIDPQFIHILEILLDVPYPVSGRSHLEQDSDALRMISIRVHCTISAAVA